jgi:hypothetical protein
MSEIGSMEVARILPDFLSASDQQSPRVCEEAPSGSAARIWGRGRGEGLVSQGWG